MPVHHQAVRRFLGPLLLLVSAVPARAEVDVRSPFAVWADDVASISAAAAAPFLGHEVRFRERGLVRVDRSRVLGAALDRSGPFVGADVAREEGWTGRGVYVAVIDSGVDFAHRAFLDAAGRPRIAWYLDMTQPSRGTGGPLDDLGYALFTGDELAAAVRDPSAPRPSPDESGHGTRVASIAAGSAEPFVGLAPGAELIVVRADRVPGGRYDEVDVADALRFVFAAAELAGRPCVANLSLGGQLGAHDGTSWLEGVIDELAWDGPGGRAVVVAAGNAGRSAVHARLDPRGAGSSATTLVVPSNGGPAEGAAAVAIVDLWSSAGSALALEVVLPDGSIVRVDPAEPSSETPLGGGAALRLELGEGEGDVASEAVAAWTGGDDGSIPPGRYELRVHGPAVVEAWLSAEATTTFFPFRLEGAVREDVTLSIPATARGALAVGSVTVRASWTNRLGALVEDPSAIPGATSSFSARGPTADGRLKPDLLAPGEWIVAAQSSAAGLPLGPGGQEATAVDTTWAAGRGTSLAAPHVAGAVALLMERERWLHPRAIRDRLRAAARADGAWEAQSGFGILDAAGILAAPEPPASESGARLVLSVARRETEAGGSSTIEAAAAVRLDGGVPGSAAAASLEAGLPLRVASSASGEVSTFVVDTSTLAPGQCATLTARAAGVARPETASVCAVARQPGGCSIAPCRGTGTAAFGLLFVLACVLCRGTVVVGRRAEDRTRRWPFVAASLAVHALLVAPLVLLLPGSPPAWRDTRVAVSLLAPEEPVPAPAASRPEEPAPHLELAVPPSVPAEPDLAAEPHRPPAREARRAALAGAAVVPVEAGAREAVVGSQPAPAQVGVSDPRSVLQPAAGTASEPRPEGRGSEVGDGHGPPGDAPSFGDPGADPGAGAGVAAAAGPAANPDPCREASEEVRAAVDARKRYPPLARRRGVSGTVEVSFAVAEDGTVAEARVASSSGAALLDEAALEAVRGAAPFPVGGCRFELPVRFSLE
ncbi:MAG: TonB family protein [Deltaproteobacteria bacterium]|nr:TonB family protein [Deltaproteobacteria bacterium]